MQKKLQITISCHIICKDYDCRLQYEKAWFVWLIPENNIPKGHNVSMIEHSLIFRFWPFFFPFFFFIFFIVRAYCIFNIIFFVSRIFKKKNSNPLDWEVCFIDKPLTFSYFLKYFSLMFGFSLCLLSFGFSKNKLVLKVLAVSTIWRVNCTGYRFNKVNQFVLKT